MDESALKRRLEALTPPDTESARERAKLAARVSLPGANAQARGAATRARNRRRTGLAFGGAIATLAIGILIATASGGGGSAVRPGVASAAELNQLATEMPHLQLVGGWQIVNTEVSDDGGLIQYRYEEEVEPGVPPTGEAEIRWQPISLHERGQQLESEGFEFAGEKPMAIENAVALGEETHEEGDSLIDEKSAQVYVSHAAGSQTFLAAGLWEEEGRTIEYRAEVPDFYTLERLMERIETLGDEEWVIALRPGGGKWLSETDNGNLEKLEKVKIGEKPDGDPIYEESFFDGTHGDLHGSFPTIYRDGDTTRVVINQPPASVVEP